MAAYVISMFTLITGGDLTHKHDVFNRMFFEFARSVVYSYYWIGDWVVVDVDRKIRPALKRFIE
jgi:hypothetical protein